MVALAWACVWCEHSNGRVRAAAMNALGKLPADELATHAPDLPYASAHRVHAVWGQWVKRVFLLAHATQSAAPTVAYSCCARTPRPERRFRRGTAQGLVEELP